MLFGLSLIGTTLQPFAERMAIYVLMWHEDYRALHNLVRKNLSSHGRRNIKTAIMFTTSLAFMYIISLLLSNQSIFAGSAFSLQGHTIGETVQLAAGADIVIFSPGSVPLNEDGLRGYLNEQMNIEDPFVQGYTCTFFRYITHSSFNSFFDHL